MIINSKLTILAEGSRGSLTLKALKDFQMDKDS